MPDRVISVPQATQIATRIKNKFDNVNGRLRTLATDGSYVVSTTFNWQDGYVDTVGLVKASTVSKYAVFSLKAGQTVTAGTRNTNIAIISITAKDTVAVGDTITPVKRTSTSDKYEEYSYTPTSDCMCVICVRASEYNAKVTGKSEALLGLYTKVEKDIDRYASENYREVDITYEQGSLSDSGEPSSNTNRARTKDFVTFNSNRVHFNVSDDYGVIIFQYDESGTFTNSVGYTYGYGSFDYEVSTNLKYKWMIRNISESAYSQMDFNDIHVYEYGTRYTDSILGPYVFQTVTDMMAAKNNYAEYGRIPLMLGAVEVGTINSGEPGTNNNRLRSANFISCADYDKLFIFNKTTVGSTQYVVWYAEDKSFIKSDTIPVGESEISKPTNAEYFKLLYGGSGYATVLLAADISVSGVVAPNTYATKADLESVKIKPGNLTETVFESTNLISDDFATETERVITSVIAKQTDKSLNFVFVTDAHFDYDKLDVQGPMFQNLYKSVRAICDDANISFVAFGGDNTNNNWTATGPSLAVQKQSTRYVRSQMLKGLNVPLLIATGNHDDNTARCTSYNGEALSMYNQEHLGNRMLSDKELYKYYAKHLENSGFVLGEVGKPYGYMDFPQQKIRVFLLDSIDIPYEKNANGAYTYAGQWTFAYRNTQLNFVANALMFADKNNPAEWSAIFIKHMSVNPEYYQDGIAHNFDTMLGIISAYQTGNKYVSSSDDETWGYTIDVDYAGRTGTVIADVAGHDHLDHNGIYGGIPYILTATARYREHDGALPTAFDVFTINPDERKVYATRFGYGPDREFTY